MIIFPIKPTYTTSTPHLAKSERCGHEMAEPRNERVIGVFSLWTDPNAFRNLPADISQSKDSSGSVAFGSRHSLNILA